MFVLLYWYSSIKFAKLFSVSFLQQDNSHGICSCNSFSCLLNLFYCQLLFVFYQWYHLADIMGHHRSWYQCLILQLPCLAVLQNCFGAYYILCSFIILRNSWQVDYFLIVSLGSITLVLVVIVLVLIIEIIIVKTTIIFLIVLNVAISLSTIILERIFCGYHWNHYYYLCFCLGYHMYLDYNSCDSGIFFLFQDSDLLFHFQDYYPNSYDY